MSGRRRESVGGSLLARESEMLFICKAKTFMKYTFEGSWRSEGKAGAWKVVKESPVERFVASRSSVYFPYKLYLGYD